jgi:hypothetical protein
MKVFPAVAVCVALAAGGSSAARAGSIFDANGNAAHIIAVDSAAGPIKVSTRFAKKIVPLIAELVGAGFKGRVHCFAAHRGGHVAHSAHLTGDACDFLPKGRQARGRNRMPTPAMMFTRRVAALIADAGLRNGCAFRDCGHVDDRSDTVLAARSHHRRTAAHHHIARRRRHSDRRFASAGE